MAGGQAVLLWFLGSGAACILLYLWAVIASIGHARRPALGLLALTGLLGALPTLLANLRHSLPLSFSLSLFITASLCLVAACAILWGLRQHPDLKRSADIAIAASLNLWLALGATLTPLSYL